MQSVKLRSGDSNKSGLGGVLQRNNIHLEVCAPGEVAKTLTALRESPATARLKAKFILATDGENIEAENLADDDEPIVCAYAEFSDHFGYFLPLAGITTVKQIQESSFDIKAAGRLNRLYNRGCSRTTRSGPPPRGAKILITSYLVNYREKNL